MAESATRSGFHSGQASGLLDQAAEWYYGDHSDTELGVMAGQAMTTAAVAEAVLATLPDREFEIRKTALLAASSAYRPEGNVEDDWEDHSATVIAKARSFEAYLRGEAK